MKPWNHWYHCTGSTYGTWVRGDPKGWRARHHREHVDGDYRKPPPTGEYGAECLALCVGKTHWHTLIRTVPLDQHRPESFLFRDARKVMGRAKGRSARALSRCGELSEGGVWAVRCRPIPIKHRAHQVNVCGYIPDHAKKGAAVYCAVKLPIRKKPRA